MSVVTQAMRALQRGKGLVDLFSALVSGAIDGVCFDQVSGAWGAYAVIAKDVGVPVLKWLGLPIPDGFYLHSVGNLGMIVTLLVLPEGGATS